MSSVFDFIDSLHETPKNYVDDGYPMVRVVDIKEEGFKIEDCLNVSEEIYNHFVKRYTPQKNDIIFSRVGSCGISILIDFDTQICLGQNTVLLKAKDNYNPLFLFQYMKSNLISIQVQQNVVGSSHKTLSLKHTKKFKINVPTLAEQQKIADCLSSLDELITANNDKIIALKQHKKGMMQGLFPKVA